MPATKIGENTTNILKLLFFIINLHSPTSNQISTYRKLNFPLTSSIYFVFLPLEMQKDSNRPKYNTRFLILSEKKQLTNPWKWQLQKPFSPVCMLLLQLATMNVFILCDNWEALLFMNVYRYSEILPKSHVAGVLKEVYILRIIDNT